MSIEPDKSAEYKELFEKMAVTPESARAHLEFLGYEEDMWDQIMGDKFGSHNVRAYISIVKGGVPRLQGEVYMEERLKDGLSRTRNVPDIK